VCGRVTQDREALVTVESHLLNKISIGQNVGQVAQLSVDPRHKGRLVVAKTQTTMTLLLLQS